MKEVNEIDQGAGLASVFLAGPSQSLRKLICKFSICYTKLEICARESNYRSDNFRIRLEFMKIQVFFAFSFYAFY